MSLDDIDKKFIEASIQKSVKKSVDENMEGIADTVTKGLQEKTNAAKQLQNLKNQKQEKKDKEDLLNALLERDKKGEATLAQKFEMLKLTIDKSIPDDFKEGSAALGKSLKGGASQAGRGLAHLNERLMMSNPITAMLYQNRDLLGAGWDIAAGTLKMGLGAAQGIGRGVASVLNSAVNLFKKKNQKAVEEGEEEKPQIEETPTGNYTPKEENNIEGEKSTAEKINEIHEWIFKDFAKFNQEQDKEQKTNNSILSKGLSGLGKTMQSISGVMEVLQAKQKLIVGGLTIGVLAIVALAAWLKGKFNKTGIPGLHDKDPEKEDLNPAKYTNKIGESIDSSILKGDDYKNFLETNKNKFTGIASSTDFSKKTSDGSYVQQGKEFKTGSMTPVLAPMDGTISNFKSKVGSLSGGKEKMYFEFQLYGKWDSSKDNGLTQNIVQLKFENILNPKVVNNMKVTIGQLLGYSDGSFKITQTLGNKESGKEILEDYQGFINYNKGENWKDVIDTTTNNLKDKDYDKINKGIAKEVQDHWFQQRSTGAATNGITNVGNRIFNWNQLKDQEKTDEFLKNIVSGESAPINGEASPEGVDEKPVSTTQIEDASVPVSTMNAGNNTDTKVESQQNQLKEQDEAQKKSSLPQPTQEDKTAQSNSPIIAAIPQELGGMQPPDYLNLSQWNAGLQGNNINIAHG